MGVGVFRLLHHHYYDYIFGVVFGVVFGFRICFIAFSLLISEEHHHHRVMAPIGVMGLKLLLLQLP
jgi:hypothetical protein